MRKTRTALLTMVAVIASTPSAAAAGPPQYPNRLDHYDLLHTLQTTYGLPLTGFAQRRSGMPDLSVGQG
ncbi:hypothetical protein [Paractinoplanes durhamensis]|uniref:Uncharacterized protein n=1 Tax=Paractinoplanes durhamensis TaxID=113563 RepID=A0ABQ3YUC4_9ACTN|nr:hypothetical protein [Actinoplanes durhamensis]GIE01120.1 hypothetical protein Adu01nite_24700 [Actinoplanes durhamensis]